ncbi:MAG TPA: hypothetical protein VK540_17275 [Polyangiaceae bacterium]|nr:hypothetical protein [Polyangiaceae bacterium]
MSQHGTTAFRHRMLDELTIGDEPSFRHVGVYADLKEVLRRAQYPFRVLPKSAAGRADRALLLNLTFWGADAGGDVLTDDYIEADVVAHAAWHHLAARAMAGAAGAKPSVEALFLGEAVASAFDVYLVGRLLGHAPHSTFLETQVPAMAEAAYAAGLGEDEFEHLLQGIAADADGAFTDLRELLFDATVALFACRGPEEAYAALAAFDTHRFASLLHRYELSNWVLYARAHGDDGVDAARARAVDHALREEKVALDWLAAKWIAPALG